MPRSRGTRRWNCSMTGLIRRAAWCGWRGCSPSRAYRRTACCRWKTIRISRKLGERGGRKSPLQGLAVPGHLNEGGEMARRFRQVVSRISRPPGVQNTKRGETLRFEQLKPFPSRSGYIAFEGLYREGERTRRAAIAVGPEYDSVGYDLVRGAAREAAVMFDTLIVCGFAFAPRWTKPHELRPPDGA